MTYLSILPEIILFATMLVVLLRKVLSGDDRVSLWLGILGGVGAIAGLVWTMSRGISSHPPLLFVDDLSRFMLLIVLVALVGVLLYSVDYLERFELQYTEWTFFLLASVLGLSLMMTTRHLVVLFVGLELFSLCFYVLCGYRRSDRDGLESALKYFVVGSVGSALLLFGIAMILASSGTMNYLSPEIWSSGRFAVWGSVLILIGGLAFKLALVPFHVWVPDVYQGAPTPVTTYMSIVVKVVVFAVLIRLVQVLFQEGILPLELIFWWLALLTIVGGNLLALVQEEVKRMLAYSSVAHAGYATIGLVSGAITGYRAIIFYVGIYLLMNLVAFGIVGSVSDNSDRCRYSNLHGLSQFQPLIAFCLAVSMISLSGLPITAGFMGKLTLFYSAVGEGLVGLVTVAVLMSVVSVAYYFRVIIHAYMKQRADDRDPIQSVGWTSRFVALLCTVAILVIGIYPAILYTFVERLSIIIGVGA